MMLTSRMKTANCKNTTFVERRASLSDDRRSLVFITRDKQRSEIFCPTLLSCFFGARGSHSEKLDYTFGSTRVICNPFPSAQLSSIIVLPDAEGEGGEED